MKRRINRKRRIIIVRRLKVLIVVLLIIVLSFGVVMVKAGSNDSVIEKNRMDGIYAIAEVRGEEHLYYLNMYTLNGRPSYCIELGVDISTDIYNSTYDFSISNLSEGKIKFIKDVSYFGYGYNNQNDYRYYMASQEIIWEYLNGVDVEWTDVLDINGNRINIDSYKKTILDLVNDYNRGNSFSGYSKGMDVKIGDEVVISDNNDNLKYYEVVSCNHCMGEIVGNNIYIDIDTNYVGSGSVTLGRKKIYEYDSMLYYKDNSQKLISNGNVDSNIVLSFNIKGDYMVLQLKDTIEIKKNNQFDYSGIEFMLYDLNKKKIKDTILCDKNGRIIVENMPYGKYYVKQTRYNYAYKFNNVFQVVNFDDDEVNYVDIIPVVNEIKIIKYFGEEDNIKEEEGIIFEVYNMDGTLYDSLITDKYGIGSLKVPYGEYMIKQKNTSYGYKKVEDFYVDLKVDYSSAVRYTLLDEVFKCNLIINTKDMDGNFILDDNFSYKIKQDGSYLEVDGKDTFDSNNGIVLIPIKLGYGDYEIEVINNSDKYRERLELINFSINDNSNYILKDGNISLEVDVNYDVVKGSVLVNTYIENIKIKDNSYYYDYVVNDNIKIDLIAGSDIIVNGIVKYKKDEVINNISTDKDGKYLIKDMYLGNYCLVIGDGSRECFDVLEEKRVNIDIKSKIDKGNVIVHNISSNLDKIRGSVIELYNSDNKLMYIGVTNDDGIIKINDLVYGDYCIKQKSVENNYLLNEEKMCFSLDSEDDIELEIVNRVKDRKFIELPNTSSDKRSISKLIVLFLLVICGGIIYKKKVINRNK